MEGFLDLLIIGFVLYATLRGMMGARRREDPQAGEAAPKPPRRTRQEPREIDWDEAIGDVLEGLGLPRPDAPRPEPRPEAGPDELEASDVSEGRRIGPERRPEPVVLRRPSSPGEPRPRPVKPEDRTLIEIAGLAEAATRRRERTVHAASMPSAPPDGIPVSSEEDDEMKAARRPRSTGLERLEDYSELERAILYAEILGPPKALGE